jgi:hypothetical protein
VEKRIRGGRKREASKIITRRIKSRLGSIRKRKIGKTKTYR